MVRCREIRLARAEVGDVDAFGFQLFRLGKNCCGRRDLDTVDAVGELHFWLLGSSSFEMTGRSTLHSLQAGRRRANTELAWSGSVRLGRRGERGATTKWCWWGRCG